MRLAENLNHHEVDVRDDPYHALAVSVLLAAAADLQSPDNMRALDSALWFLLGDGEVYLHALGLDVNPVSWIIGGGPQVKRIGTSLRFVEREKP